jgi:hypothetical protein
MSLLPQPAGTSHPRYAQLLGNSPDSAQAHRFVADLFARSYEYLDARLRSDLPKDFPSRFWEMYVTCMLLESGIALVRTRDRPVQSGPDLLLADGETWIEAVTAGPGTGADALSWPRGNGVAYRIPDDRIILRILSAITTKSRVMKRYINHGLVSPQHRCVIAVNAGEVPLARVEQSVPRILRSVFPIGSMEVLISVPDGHVTGSRYAYRPRIAKEKGQEVDTTFFLSPESSHISAVFYACVDEYNHPHPLQDAVHAVKNPQATVEWPEGRLVAGREYTARAGVIETIDHRSSSRKASA